MLSGIYIVRQNVFSKKFCRSNICHYRLEEALKVMSEITGFERNLESFIFSRSLDFTVVVPK